MIFGLLHFATGKAKLNPNEWVLIFLFADPKRNEALPKVSGRLLFFKEFFVFVKEIRKDLEGIFNFIPYKYGPYSFELEDILKDLQNSELVRQESEGDRVNIVLTLKGFAAAQKLWEIVDTTTKEKLERLRRDADKSGYIGVLRYVYAKYPEYTIFSRIKGCI